MRRRVFARTARACAVLAASAVFSPAFAQGVQPDRTAPASPQPREPAIRVPVDPGAVVVPPPTGAEGMAKAPRKAVDPEIDDATRDIDRRNARKSEQKRGR